MDLGLKESITPFDHQITGFRYAFKHKYSINAFEAGCGKTLVGVTLANSLKLPTLIVCPAYLKYNWRKEIQGLCKEHKSIAMFKTTNDIYAYVGAEHLDDFIIINYEQIKHCEHLFKWADLVIYDEAQKLSSQTSQRSIFSDEFIFNHEVERLLFLTGTPIQNRVEDLYNLLTFMGYDPSKSNGKNVLDKYPTLESFCEHFSFPHKVRVKTRRGTITSIVYKGLQNTRELQSYLDYKFIRLLQKDVVKLKPFRIKDVMVCYKDDKKLLEEYEEHVEKNKSNVNPRAKKNSAVLKAKYTAQYVEDIVSDERPVVVFSAHRESAKYIADKLGFAYIDGQVPPKKRQDIVDQFQAGEINGISATIGGASTGLTLTRARDLVMNDYDWSPSNNDQAFRRIYRIGQTGNCILHSMFGSPQDEKISINLREKIDVINELFDTYTAK